MDDNESISAFAFRTGKTIEALINERTNDLEQQNRLLETKILQWYLETRDDVFAEHFGIYKTR